MGKEREWRKRIEVEKEGKQIRIEDETKATFQEETMQIQPT